MDRHDSEALDGRCTCGSSMCDSLRAGSARSVGESGSDLGAGVQGAQDGDGGDGGSVGDGGDGGLGCQVDANCTGKLVCIGGVCQTNPCPANYCGDAGSCVAICLAVNPCANVTCPENQTCIQGVCVPGCYGNACSGVRCAAATRAPASARHTPPATPVVRAATPASSPAWSPTPASA